MPPGTVTDASVGTRSLVAAFERQVDLRPDAVAVQLGERALTYGQLDGHANRLARRLRALGVGAGDVVGVMAERGLETTVALVGTLKAGAAYTPLDPDSPRMRLRRQLDAVRACAVVTPERLAERLAGASQPLVALDSACGALAGEDGGRLGLAPAQEDLCAVLFTSGSTGIPKGVALEHRNLLNLLERAPRFAPLPGEGALHVSAPQFDAAAYETWASLTRGARLVCHPPGRPDPHAVFRTVAEHEVRWSLVATSVFHQLVESGPEPLTAMRVLLAGGEAMLPRYARRFRAICPRTRLVNLYGPTETTVFGLAHEVGEEAERDEPIPIGRAVAATRLRVLGVDGEEVARGERGELHLGGPGVARGYLHQPELTAERFRTADDGVRWYRTGDVVRVRPDGALEIFGRLDDQVKLRGYRVEPLEVEAHLAAHPAVRAAAVVVRERAGRRSLAAFAVPADPDACGPEALRAHLAGRLPEYMVPASVTLLDALPRTPSDKVDRRALARIADPRGEAAAREDACPRPLAREIAALLGELLELPAVDPADDFLALGGESLVAVRLLGRLRDRLGVELPISAVFDARTPEALAERVAAASAESPLPPLQPRRHGGAVPATAGQAKALMVSELAEESLPYQSQAAHRILGSLDVPALERALSMLVARHEILRTTFPREEGRWLQRVHEPWRVRLPVADLRGAADREAVLEAHVADLARIRLDPARLPLVRWSLARLADDDHALLSVEHHVVHDGVSTAVVLRELAELYRAEVSGLPAALTTPGVQYRDFAAWQEELTASPRGRTTLGWWRERLADPPPALELPFDRPRPARQTYRGDSLRRTLSPALTERVRSVARAAGATPFALMLAAYATLLARHGDGDQVVVGSGLANRRTLASERLLGMVVNTVALPLDAGGDPTVGELVERVHRTVLAAQGHQDVPFERVVEHLAPARAGNAAPLYQTLFSFHDAPVRALDLGGGATLVPRDGLPNGSAKADLNVVVVHRRGGPPAAADPALYERIAEDGLTLVWEYNADLFERATAQRLLDRFVHLLDQMTSGLARPLAELDAADERDRAWLSAQSGRTAPYERDATIAEAFEARVAEAPHAPAVTADGQTLSYANLDRHANRLARRLRASGVERGVPVGVCMERSLDLVVAFLAVAKAGGAYVPLDPLDPRERLGAQLGALGIELVLTHARHRDRVPAPPHVLVCVDDELDLAREDDVPPTRRCGPLDPAYVMFTSGSTGAAKAVQVPQRAVLRLVRGADYVDLGPHETLLALAPPVFDASTFEIWGALLNGARLVVAPPGPLAPAELADLVAREHVGTLWLTAGLFHRMVDDRPDALARLRQLLAGGDVLSPDHVRRALATMHPAAVLVNGYGPTEGTTFTAAHRLRPGEPVPAPVPIGRPIANTSVHVLDGAGRPLPPGVPGELWIGGDGVALGYANDAALTADRFRSDPFSAEPGARMYRSGDRARWRADGTLEFLGRADRQLKVRGFRIEPGEVEEALRSHPGVADVHVGPFERSGRDRVLAAYVVAHGGADPSDAELRAHAARTLPVHALPTAWCRLQQLPLTPNGKVDTAALPAPEPPAGRAVRGGGAPLDPLERRLAAIWERALDVDRVGPEDDFFELGGHSLLAVELFDAVERAFGRRLPLATIFEAPTVRRLAAALREDGWEQSRGCLVTLTPRGATTMRPPLFLVTAGDGNAVGFGALARRLGPGQPLLAFQQRGINGGAPLHVTVEAMAAHYLRAIRRVQPHGPYLLGGRCLGSLVAYELARRLEARGEDVALLAVLDSGGPPWRMRLLADGTPYDPIMHAALHRDDAPPPGRDDVFSHAGGERLLRWLREPVVTGADGIVVTRYAHAVYQLRSDVRDAFPDLRGADAAAFRAWIWSRGRIEHALCEPLLGDAPDSLPPLGGRGMRERTRALRGRIAWRAGEAADLLTLERRPAAALRRRERVREASLRASAVYRAGAYGGVVTLIRSEEYRVQRLLEQWHGLDTAGVVERHVRGSHRSMLREPDVERLAACLRELIDDALSAAGAAGSSRAPRR